MLIHGTTIKLVVKSYIGDDEFGKPMYTETYEDVEDVLVAPVMNVQSSIPDITYLEKKVQALNLGIPKGDTHDWVDAEIIYHGDRYKAVGFPVEGIEDLVPLGWHKIVTVERYG